MTDYIPIEKEKCEAFEADGPVEGQKVSRCSRVMLFISILRHLWLQRIIMLELTLRIPVDKCMWAIGRVKIR